MNSITLVGNMCADPELKQTPSGISVVRFSLAVRRPYSKDKTDFLICVAWRQQAEFICQYGKKGRKLALEGVLQSDSYEKNGQKIYTHEISINSAEFCDARLAVAQPGADAGTGAAYAPAAYTNGDQNGFEELPSDEELPFA